MPKRTRVVTLTGTRTLTKRAQRRIRRRVLALVEDLTVRKIYFGGALGSDTYALLKALKYRDDARYPKFIVVVPSTLQDQPKDTIAVSKCADKIIELRLPPGQKWVYQKRNEYMVDRSTDAEAFWTGEEVHCGTYNCMQYAIKKLGEDHLHVTRVTDSV